MVIGLDTGFFVTLFQGLNTSVEIWKKIVKGEVKAIVAAPVVFELRRLALKGIITREFCDALFEALRCCVEVKEINFEIAEKASYISHGTGMPAVDALIYSCYLEAQKIYTVDSDFLLPGKKKPEIVLLKLT